MKLILASTSPYRKTLLEKLKIPFTCSRPNVDESPKNREPARDLVERLARSKAQAVGTGIPKAYVIGSDQVASLDDKILGKPGNYDIAFAQLKAASGRAVTFHTGLCIFDTNTNTYHSTVEDFVVSFKSLSDEQITRYLHAEQPYDCAGSFKSEGLGIMLFSALNGRDPNTLVGLPLIRLTELFTELGIDLFEHIRA
ncbi:MAG: septum formation protein [Paraglaciecola sp.]|jgi:septum formation protein